MQAIPETNRSFFDAQFQEALLDTISKDRLPKDLDKILNDGDHRRMLSNERIRAFIYKLNETILIWLCNFERIDILASSRELKYDSNKPIRGKLSNRTSNRKWWPRALLVAYIFCLSLLLMNSCLQYTYDARKIRLDKIRMMLADSNERAVLVNQFKLDANSILAHFERSANESRKWLKSLGASHLEWPFIVEAEIIQYFVLTFFIYIVAPLGLSQYDWALLSAKLLSGTNNEAQIRFKLVLDELSSFSINSSSFVKRKLEHASKDLALSIHSPTRTPVSILDQSIFDRLMRSSQKQLNQYHRSTIEQLKIIALEGRLNPLYRSPACRDKLALVYLTLTCLSFLLMTCCPGAFYYLLNGFFESKGRQVEFEGFRDILMSVYFLYIVLISAMSMMFFVPMHGLNLYDQLVSMGRLETLILATIQANELRCNQLIRHMSVRSHNCSKSDSTGTSFELRQIRLESFNDFQDEMVWLGRALEQDVLVILMQCRLTSKSYDKAKGLMSLSALTIVSCALSVAITMRLHSSYYYPELETISVLFGIVAMNGFFVFLVPLGVLHQRCSKTYSARWSLAAQMSYFESVSSLNRCLMIEMNVAIFTLRRELADEVDSTNRFACQVLTFPVTYSNLIKAAFWFYLALISLLDNSGRFLSPIGDPFGLYGLDLEHELGNRH